MTPLEILAKARAKRCLIRPEDGGLRVISRPKPDPSREEASARL